MKDAEYENNLNTIGRTTMRQLQPYLPMMLEVVAVPAADEAGIAHV